MILQTKASILAVLLGLEGGQDPHVEAVWDDIILSRELGHEIECADDVSNDRTYFKSHN